MRRNEQEAAVLKVDPGIGMANLDFPCGIQETLKRIIGDIEEYHITALTNPSERSKFGSSYSINCMNDIIPDCSSRMGVLFD